jgi:hypothetical protein
MQINTPHAARQTRPNTVASQVAAFKKYAEPLADFTLARIVTRRDVCGITLPDGRRITGHEALTRELLIRHYRGLENIGAHLTSADSRCLCLVGDVDAHDAKADPDLNWRCVLAIVDMLKAFDLIPLICDSNGAGGFHVREHFKKPLGADIAHWLAQQIKQRLKAAGLPDCEVFPKQGEINIDTPYGNWVRLPGKHPKRDHWTRIYDLAGDKWLEGEQAVKAILAVAGDDAGKLLGAFKAAQPATDAKAGKATQKPANGQQASEEEIRSALLHCPNADASYDAWIGRGFALHDWDSARGLDLWLEWSRQSSKHKDGECERKWLSMGPGGGITAKSLFKMAYGAGWTWQPSPNGTGQQTSPPGDVPILNDKKKWMSCQHNSKVWLSHRGLTAKIRYDWFRRNVFVDGKPVDDAIVTGLTGELERDVRRPWSQNHIRSALIDVGHANEYSSLTDWLDSLKWDQTYRLNTFFNEAYDIPYTLYNGECARVLFLSAVARAYQPGCQADVMVVLISDQGLYKSTGLAALCPFSEWFAEDLGGDLMDRKATGECLEGKWLVECGEISRINRATLEDVKSFVSRRVDRYRPAYGHIAQDFPRCCVFIGTTNNRQPLQDVQNRRFMPLHVKQGDVLWIKANRDQIWAEAVVRYRKGEKWWVTDPERIKECVDEQEEARQVDPWQEILDAKLVGLKTVTMPEAAAFLGIWPGQLERRHETRIGLALHALGFKRKRVRQGSKLSWIYELFLP